MRFKYIWVLGTLIIPILYLLLVLIRVKNNEKEISLFKRFLLVDPKRQIIYNNLFLSLSIIFLIISIARPQAGITKVKSEQPVKKIYLAIDMSASMRTGDVSPSRLERAKLDSLSIINSLNGEKIGIILFSDRAYLYLPATNDYDVVINSLQAISENTTVNLKTNLTSPIRLFDTLLKNETKDKTLLVILTDGEDNIDKFSARLRKIRNTKINTLIVGIGTDSGAPVPESYTKDTIIYLEDNNGVPVISKLNIEIIKRIANTVNGSYFISENILYDTKRIKNKINSLKYSVKRAEFTVKRELFQLPLAVAIAFLIIYSTVYFKNKEYFLLEKEDR